MDRVYQSNAIETPPSSVASSGSYPTAGNKASGQLATVPGPYWFYSITEEIRNAIVKAGLTPDAAKVNQLADALGKFLPLSGGTMTGNLGMGNKNINAVRSIELIPTQSSTDGGFIDFHYAGATGDYTSRIIESESGKLSIAAPNGVYLNTHKVITSEGGLLNGLLLVGTSDNNFVYTNDTTNGYKYICLQAGLWGQGARIQLMRDDSPKDAGELALYGGSTNFRIKPNGDVTCNGKKVVCVESWISGTSGYRKYSDGFIEQWGKTSTSSRETTTVTLHTAMTTMTYNVTISQTGAADTWSTYATVNSKTQFALNNNYSTGAFWRVCGY